MADATNQKEWHWTPMFTTPSVSITSGSIGALGPDGARATANAGSFGGATITAVADL